MDSILEMRENDPERARAELAEDTVLEALFKAPVEPPSEQCAHTKRHHSIYGEVHLVLVLLGVYYVFKYKF